MRVIDLHCYPNTEQWSIAQGPFVEALGTYWGRAWVPKTEAEVASDFQTAGVEAVLVALDIETVIGTPPCWRQIFPIFVSLLLIPAGRGLTK